MFESVDFFAGVDRSRIFELGHCLAENQDFPRASAVSRGGGLAENLDFCHVSAASRGGGLPKNLDFLHVSGCSPGTPGGPGAPGASPETLAAPPFGSTPVSEKVPEDRAVTEAHPAARAHPPETRAEATCIGSLPAAGPAVAFSPDGPPSPKREGTPEENLPDGRGPGQSRCSVTPSVDTFFTVFHLNVRGLRDTKGHNLALVNALLAQLDLPTFVVLTETWLDRGIESANLTGYHRVSRRDRRGAVRTDRGGVAVFARDGFELSIVHLGDSADDERSWHVVHSDSGPILLGAWYRPPAAKEVASIQRFEQEFQQYSSECVSSIVVGDMNVHNTEWLRWSNGRSDEGEELENVCCLCGLSQHVNGPTRGDHLLDLVLSDFGSGIRTKITPGIHDNDHRGVLASVKLSVPAAEPVRRKVYDFQRADWKRLQRALRDEDWTLFFQDKNADDAADQLTGKILENVESCIPSRWIDDKAYAHPWMNSACQEALRRKHEAMGTVEFEAKRDECTKTFLDTYQTYLGKVRGKLQSMSSSSRGWWKLSDSLLTKANGQENIPPLKRPDASWAKNASEKAAELARVFRDKSVLPDPATNEYTPLQEPCDARMGPFLRVRPRTVRRILKELDETSGTGPDLLPARILKKCSAELTWPITLLTRKLLHEGRWPNCWRTHWVQSIFKKGSKAEAKNYRGVHLTPQLSKVVERTVGTLLVPWLESQGAFGPNQYAYSKGRGYKDVLAINVCSWILSLERGLLVGLYCSDVAGAFDRVDHERLSAKLGLLGLHPQLHSFLSSWLEDRVSEVIVGGRSAGREPLRDSVFQGTVLGPPLWNAFYGDARRAVTQLGFIETVFADDFNCWKSFRKKNLPVQVKAELELRGAQKELHLWGNANSVVFDPAKESFQLLHRSLYLGDDFRILGVLFDSQLLMYSATRVVATEAGWRLQKLLRARRYYTTPELMHSYKAQVLSYIESSTPGLYHAAPSVLSKVDRVQRRLLRELGLTEVEGLLRYRLAPLPSRRDMSMLGMLHKVALGIAPPQLAALFPVKGVVVEDWQVRRLRYWRPLHTRQLSTPADQYSSQRMQLSLFGLVRCYNLLPQRAVDHKTVQGFQRCLQEALKVYATSAEASTDWQDLYSTGWKRYTRTRTALDRLFT